MPTSVAAATRLRPAATAVLPRAACALVLTLLGPAPAVRAMAVSCLGDSNTDARFAAGLHQVSWCDQLARWRPRWTVVNHGLVYATAVDRCAGAIGLFCGDGLHGQLRYALSADAPDVVIAAFGTNDILNGPYRADDVLAAYEDMAAAARRAGVAFLPASTAVSPTRPAERNAEVERLKTLLRRRFRVVVDFSRVGPEGLRADGIHLNARGQRERYRAARAALRRWLRVRARARR